MLVILGTKILDMKTLNNKNTFSWLLLALLEVLAGYFYISAILIVTIH